MTYLKILPALILSSWGIVGLTNCKNYNNHDIENVSDAKEDEKGFAVLELFTSEGCSSCPSADNLLAKIQNEYKDQSVYILAFHVDYWDKQGWKDVFSSRDYTDRQREYGNRFNTGSIYTPQLVVNGKSEFVGSNEFKTRDAIKRSLTTENKTKLSIQSNREAEKLILNYQVSEGSKNSRLLIAIVQKSAVTKVERGENKGRLLSHVQIVRSLHSETLSEKGKGISTIKLPNGFNSQEWEVIALVQELNSKEISAATRVNL
jgi:hypothetical protein